MSKRNLLLVLLLSGLLALVAGSAGAQACPGGLCTVGTAANDNLTGGPGNDCICGLGGNDVIRGAGGNDDLYGNGGSDCLFGDDQNDDAYGGNGTDTVHGNNHNDDVYGGNQNDCVFGDADEDDVYGDAGFDVCRTGPNFTSCENLSGLYFCVKVINPDVGAGGTYTGPGDVVPTNP